MSDPPKGKKGRRNKEEGSNYAWKNGQERNERDGEGEWQNEGVKSQSKSTHTHAHGSQKKEAK